jgi:hypothetical protein
MVTGNVFQIAYFVAEPIVIVTSFKKINDVHNSLLPNKPVEWVSKQEKERHTQQRGV